MVILVETRCCAEAEADSDLDLGTGNIGMWTRGVSYAAALFVDQVSPNCLVCMFAV